MWRGHFFLLFVFPPSVMKWLLPHLCKHYETLFFKTWPMERFVILFWFGGQNDYRYKWIPKWMDMNGNRKTQEQSNENREKRSVKAKRKVKAAMFIYGPSHRRVQEYGAAFSWILPTQLLFLWGSCGLNAWCQFTSAVQTSSPCLNWTNVKRSDFWGETMKEEKSH